MVQELGSEFGFRIITRDRDVTDKAPYPSIAGDTWNQVGKSQVYYALPGHLSPRTIRSLAHQTKPSVIYLNSFFSTLTIKCLALRKLRLLPATPFVVAPRGEFSPGALALKRMKKRLYIAVAKALGLYSDVCWQASATAERDDILAVFGNRSSVHIAPDVPAPIVSQAAASRPKLPGEARFVFLSRISPKKNLLGFIKMLNRLSGNVHLSIVGPVGESSYWRQCQKALESLAGTVPVDVIGPVPHERVHDLLSEHHFFVLPTFGENFGHAILEALAAGLPVVISDQTPWRGLQQKGVGWDLALDDERGWISVLQRCVEMSQAEFDRMAECARDHAVRWSSVDRILAANRALFERAMER